MKQSVMTSKLGDAVARLTVKSGHFNGKLGRIVARLLVMQETELELVFCGMRRRERIKAEKWPLKERSG